MVEREKPRLAEVVHRLRSGRRLFASPMWLIPVSAAAAAAVAAEPVSQTTARDLLIAQLPAAIALLILARQWDRLAGSGVVRDWKLTGGRAAQCSRAMFGTLWRVWWLSAVLFAAIAVVRGITLYWRYILDPGALLVVLHVPGGAYILFQGPNADQQWFIHSLRLHMVMSLVHLALWGFALRWLSELTFLRLRHGLAAAALTLGIHLGLVFGLRALDDLLLTTVTMQLQSVWPALWPIAAKFLLGMHVVWLIYPAALLTIGLAARWAALRARRAWWEGVN